MGLENDARTAAAADERAGGAARATVALADAVDVAVGELTTLKVTASQAEERRQNARQTLERLRAERAEHETRAARLKPRWRTTTRARSRCAPTRRGCATRRRCGRPRPRRAPGPTASARARSRSGNAPGGARGQLRAARARSPGWRRRWAPGAAHPGGACGGRRCEEQVVDRYRDVALVDVVHDYHLRPPVGAEEERRASELRGLIERMGEINLTAIEESEELQKRYEFLTAQKADLEAAIEQLEKAIEQINRTSRKRVPRDVRRGQREVPGGVPAPVRRRASASLALTDESDLLETGIEIIAQPPGKKLSQNIELLSGGEKALTAVSLMFAIFLIKPSPFCLLDEVDAPLDEANVGRYNEMVREMTDRSQFILITHNKRTMEIADGLYGVTMEEPGVSKLVAVNLQGSQARAHRSSRDRDAERARGLISQREVDGVALTV